MVDTTLEIESCNRVLMSSTWKRIQLSGTALPQMGLGQIAELTLVEAVQRALHATGYLALRTVTVSICSGSIRLDGRLPSYHLKQMAQSTAKHVPGVIRVMNDVEVVNGR